MKAIRNSLLFPLLLLAMVVAMVFGILSEQDASQAIAQPGPLVTREAPNLTAVAEGSEVIFDWTEVGDAQGYRLLFSISGGDMINDSYEIDMGLDTELILDFADKNILETLNRIESPESIEAGLSFYVKVQAYYKEGVSFPSNAEYVMVGEGIRDANEGGENPPGISARVVTEFCTLFAEPARSCVLGHAIYVPVGESNAFTASGGTNGFTCVSGNPSIAIAGFTSPEQGIGWVTGVNEGSTFIDIWDGQGCRAWMSVMVLPAGANYIYISDFDPVPYPHSKLTAGVRTTFNFRVFYPPISGRIVRLKYDFGKLGNAANSHLEKSTSQLVFNDTKTFEAETNAASSMPFTVAGTIPFGWDYLVIWVQYLDSSGSTVLAESCKAGWLIQ